MRAAATAKEPCGDRPRRPFDRGRRLPASHGPIGDRPGPLGPSSDGSLPDVSGRLPSLMAGCRAARTAGAQHDALGTRPTPRLAGLRPGTQRLGARRDRGAVERRRDRRDLRSRRRSGVLGGHRRPRRGVPPVPGTPSSLAGSGDRGGAVRAAADVALRALWCPDAPRRVPRLHRRPVPPASTASRRRIAPRRARGSGSLNGLGRVQPARCRTSHTSAPTPMTPAPDSTDAIGSVIARRPQPTTPNAANHRGQRRSSPDSVHADAFAIP